MKKAIEGVYKTKKRWILLTLILCFIAFFVALGVIMLNESIHTPTITSFLLIVPIGGAIGFTYLLIEVAIGHIAIDAKSISRRMAFKTQSLYLTGIKGFRIHEKAIRLEPIESGNPTIVISRYTQHFDDIVYWISSNYADLDAKESADEEARLLENDEFGLTRNAREYRLEQARKVCKAINIAGGILAGWIFLYPTPYLLCVCIGIVLPLLAITVIFLYPGIIQLDEKKNSVRPSVSVGLFLPSIMLMVRALLDFEIVDYDIVWIFTGGIAVVMISLLLIGSKEYSIKDFRSSLLLVSLIGVSVAYGFGTTALLNCTLDTRTPEIFEAEVISMEISSGKTTTYYVTVTPWGPRTEAEKISVAQEEYEQIAVGDVVNVYLMPGFFKIRWFFLLPPE
jgi:hypothetical protein